MAAQKKRICELVQGLVALEEMKAESGTGGSVLAGLMLQMPMVSWLCMLMKKRVAEFFEDKATKNLFACEHVVNNMRHTKTVGVIQEKMIMTGLTRLPESVGVVCRCSTTNPTNFSSYFKALIS